MPRIERAVARPVRAPDYARDRNHLAFIRQLCCLACGRRGPCEAAHIRSGSNAGMGKKPRDSLAVPLCGACHAEQHNKWNGSEIDFWGRRMAEGVSDPIGVAAQLYRVSGSLERGHRAIAHARPGLPTAGML